MNFGLILQNISQHIQLDKTETDFFTSLLENKTIRRNVRLLTQGEICRTENFIIKGCLKMYSIDENGFEHIVQFGIEDWWISDLCSFLTKTPANYSISALEDTEVLQINKTNFDLLFEQIPKFEHFYRLMFQNAFIAQQNRINKNLSFTAEQRYADFLKQYPQLEQRIPQKYIAAYLGMTPVFLSMLRKKLSSP
uniref:Crp/Fnr family transcriptional regulator n=1 Tax=Pedobacter schmidteae TaxID=2201271 RepID=UPI000EB300DD|nr:Crp/Fnr family transcriptional regulator [Pedobacter schmidteae]